MAGYMTKLNGYVYEGELLNGTAGAVENGVLLVVGGAGTKLVAPAADTNSKFICKEVTDIYGGIKAYRFIADKLAANYYFVENGFDINDSTVYDTTAYAVAKDLPLRAHPLLPGDEFITTKVTGTITAGTAYGVKADGTIG